MYLNYRIPSIILTALHTEQIMIESISLLNLENNAILKSMTILNFLMTINTKWMTLKKEKPSKQ